MFAVVHMKLIHLCLLSTEKIYFYCHISYFSSFKHDWGWIINFLNLRFGWKWFLCSNDVKKMKNKFSSLEIKNSFISKHFATKLGGKCQFQNISRNKLCFKIYKAMLCLVGRLYQVIIGKMWYIKLRWIKINCNNVKL